MANFESHVSNQKSSDLKERDISHYVASNGEMTTVGGRGHYICLIFLCSFEICLSI